MDGYGATNRLYPPGSLSLHPSTTSTALGRPFRAVRCANIFPRTSHTFLTTKLPLWAVHLGPSKVAQLSIPCFPVLVPRTFTTLHCELARLRATRTSILPSLPPLPALPSPTPFPGLPTEPGGKKKKKKTLRPWGQREWYPPLFRPSSCPTVLLVVSLSLLCRRTGRHGQILSDLAKWSRHGLSWMAHQWSQPCLPSRPGLAAEHENVALLDFYINAEHFIQLVILTHGQFLVLALRLTYENTAHFGWSPVLH